MTKVLLDQVQQWVDNKPLYHDDMSTTTGLVGIVTCFLVPSTNRCSFFPSSALLRILEFLLLVNLPGYDIKNMDGDCKHCMLDFVILYIISNAPGKCAVPKDVMEFIADQQKTKLISRYLEFWKNELQLMTIRIVVAQFMLLFFVYVVVRCSFALLLLRWRCCFVLLLLRLYCNCVDIVIALLILLR